jgi:hypothetical protein
MNSGNSALTIQYNSLEEAKSSFSDIKSSIEEATQEINTCIENLTTAAEAKDNVITSVDNIGDLFLEHDALTQEIASSLHTQESTFENMNKSIGTLL